MKYWAFLSYSHTDQKWGDCLHKALETYRVPRRLIGKESRDGKIPARLFPIFRSDTAQVRRLSREIVSRPCASVLVWMN
jgi:hypothetical protein